LVIAGNALVAPEKHPEGILLSHNKKSFNQTQQAKLVAPLKELDNLLAQLSRSLPVDILPGSNDPTLYVLPQQPFARCLLPKSFQNATFKSVTNPYEFEIEGKTFLGISGQTFQNMEKYMTITDKLNLANQTLEWRHIAPTAPDQLGCYPYYDTDPFVLSQCPHVYFIGNQKEFETKLIEGSDGQRVRIICLPAFADNPIVVLVNLNHEEG